MPKKRPGYGLATWDRQKYPLLVKYTDDATFEDGVVHYRKDGKTAELKWPALKVESANKDYYKLLITSRSSWWVLKRYITVVTHDKPTIIIMVNNNETKRADKEASKV